MKRSAPLCGPAGTAGVFLVAAAGVAVWGADRAYPAPLVIAAAALGAALCLTAGLRAGLRTGPACAWIAATVSASLLAGLAALRLDLSWVELGPVTTLVGWVFPRAHFASRGVRIETESVVLRVLPTLGSLAVPFWAAVMAGCALLVAREPGAVRGALVRMTSAGFVLTAACAVAYLAGVAWCFVDEERNFRRGEAFSHVGDLRFVVAATCWVPWALSRVLRAAPRDADDAQTPSAERSAVAWRPRLIATFAAVSACCFVAVAGRDLWVAERADRVLRILIDDAHSGDWETSSRRFDEGYFGDIGQYNYGAAAEWLARDHRVEIHETGPVTRGALEGVDVMIAKTPAVAFTDDELGAIRDWVRAGGRLVLLGDHTNLFGMNEKLNAFLEGVPMRFRDDAVNDVSGSLSRVTTAWYNSSGSWRGVGATQALTSCSIGVGWGAEGLLRLPSCHADAADYGADSYFGDMRVDGSEPIGSTWVAARAAVGRGRIVCFSDSTQFSNFTLCEPGHDRELMALLDAAAGEDRVTRPWLLAALVVACGVAVVAAARGIRSASGRFGGDVATGLLIGAGAGMLALTATDGVVRRDRAEHLVRTRSPRAFIPMRNANFALLPAIGARKPELEAVSVSTLITLFLRRGIVPCFIQIDDELPELRPGDMVVLFDPETGGERDADVAATVTRAAADGAQVRLVCTRETALWLGRGETRTGAALRACGADFGELEASATVAARLTPAGAGAEVWFWDWTKTCDATLGHCFEQPGVEATRVMQELCASLPPRP